MLTTSENFTPEMKTLKFILVVSSQIHNLDLLSMLKHVQNIQAKSFRIRPNPQSMTYRVVRPVQNVPRSATEFAPADRHTCSLLRSLLAKSSQLHFKV